MFAGAPLFPLGFRCFLVLIYVPFLVAPRQALVTSHMRISHTQQALTELLLGLALSWGQGL